MGRAFEVRKASMAKTAAAKTKVYSRYGREIYVAAKNGGVDPDANLTRCRRT
jgi:transcriptional/translational regulatory protein YebC/TACO1